MIYFLLPTRRRPALLNRSIQSLWDTCTKPYIATDGTSPPFKIAIAVDPDDVETLEPVQAWASHDPTILLWETPERYGYRHLYEYYNGLCRLADVRDNDLLVLWNDDARMTTPEWDKKLLAGDPDALVLDLQHNLSPQFVCFPAMRGSLYNALGHYTRETPHVDSYIQDVARQLGKVRPVDVFVQHDRPDLANTTPDATFLEGRAGLAHEHYFSGPFQQLITSDAAMVREKLCL